MKALIFGITGFAGSHLAEHLLSRGDVEVAGARRGSSSLHRIEAIKDKIELHEIGLDEPGPLAALLKKARPDWIFNLAGQSNVAISWQRQRETFETNLLGFGNLLEAVTASGVGSKVLAVGSADEYGASIAGDAPIGEETPLVPITPYGVSKAAMDHLAAAHRAKYDAAIFRARAFNHTGPRNSRAFVTANFAWQIAEIEAGRQEPVIWVGNLDARRDFSDVRDVVGAYAAILEKGRPGEAYNVGSGEAISIREILDRLLSMTDLKIEVHRDENRMRPIDLPMMRADIGKIKRETGWRPEIPLDKTLADLLEYWRGRAAS